MNTYLIYFRTLILLAVILFIISCSAERKNIASKTYHNTTARYNAYFIARAKLDEVEQAVKASHKPNYNQILKIYPEVDSTTVSSVKKQLEECIEKASIAIQRHKNSKWVDDSYILIGRARYYTGDYANAVQTFKYVNTKGDDDDARHEALIHLMKTFIDAKEENNAIAVSDFLKKEKVKKENLKNLYLTRAHLYQKREDYDNVVANLVEAAPLLQKNDDRAKIYFIIGQIYQQLGFEAEAYNNYRLSLKSNPDYELSFYTKLYMFQVYDLKKSNDIKKVRNYFTKLLKDSKNKEYRDKIYYEMAEFEAKQENMDKAIQHYNSSIRASSQNPRQKSYGYLQLGKIYYEKIKDYELAKLYYDSTISVMPKDEPEFADIQSRQVILKDFVEQLNIIQFQDSLLTLSTMDSATVVAMIDQEIEKEEQKRKKEELKSKKKGGSSTSTRNNDNVFAGDLGSGSDSGSGSGGNWYFYSTNAVGAGQLEFTRIWGSRKLEDNWRRLNKEAVPDFAQGNNSSEGVETAQVNDGPSAGAMAKENILKQIPYTEADKKVALNKIEKAYFKLGNIYNFDLQEKVNAGETFEILLDRFPEIENEVEVLYLLYLIYKELEDDKHLVYKDKILTTYHNSTYAKIILNPNFKQESDIANEKLKVIYKEAYAAYQKGEYDEAKQLLSAALNNYPDTDFRDHLKILEILLIGKTENVHNYQYALKNFVKDYKESELVPYAQKLLKASEDLMKRIVAEKGAQYIEYFDQNHFLIIMYQPDGKVSDQLPQRIDKFNEKHFAGTNLKAANLKFDNSRSIIIITEFKDRNQALKYYEKFNAENVNVASEGNENLDNFVISKDNFQIFYKTKDLKNYISFFQKHYK